VGRRDEFKSSRTPWGPGWWGAYLCKESLAELGLRRLAKMGIWLLLLIHLGRVDREMWERRVI